jgi:pyridoxal 5'-phosphate synthase pdxS subunit
MMRTKGEAGTGNIVEAVRHIRTVSEEIAALKGQSEKRLRAAAKEMRVPYELVKYTVKAGRLPVVNFVAGGIATPADAALSMWLGADGVFVGSGIFKAKSPAKFAVAIVQATTHWKNAAILAEVSAGLGEAMKGIEMRTIPEGERLSKRGW